MPLFQVCRLRGKRGRDLLLGILAAAGIVLSAPAEATPGPAGLDQAVDAGVLLLRGGRYQEAERHFRRLAGSHPEAPEPLYYAALSLWWQGVYAEEGDTPAIRQRFDASIEQAIALAEARRDPRGDLVAGSAYLLRAQVRARDKQALKAGWDARRGKKALEAAVRSPLGRADAYFGLGAYNYYADHVNALVKGLRLLLFIPGGDAALGIRQLETAARAGSRTQVEAHLLLGLIFASEEEERYGDAVEHIRQAARLAPASPAVRLALAEVLDGVGQEAEARSVLEAFLASPDPPAFDYPQAVRAEAALRLSHLHLRGGRPQAAASVLRGALQPPGTEPAPEVVRRARSFLVDLEWELGETAAGARRAAAWDLPWPPAAAGSCAAGGMAGLASLEAGPLDGAAVEALARQPFCPQGTPRWRGLALAGALARLGRLPAAREILLRDAGSDAQPGEVRGWSRILLGRLAASEGRHEEARQWFRQARETRGFSGELRARYYLHAPAEAAQWPEAEVGSRRRVGSAPSPAWSVALPAAGSM